MESHRLRAVARSAVNGLSKFLCGAYVAGPELRDAVTAFDRFARSGQGGTLGYFNNETEEPRRIASLDVDALEALADGRRNGYVSIKVPAMKYDRELVEEIARASARTGVGIHFDSHAVETTDPTYASIEGALQQTSMVGCTIPGRWQRSLRDADRAVDLGLRVRVVKGQWADPAQPDMDLRAGYLGVIGRLAGRAKAVAVATHDPILAQSALRCLREAGTPCEMEVLFGLPMRPALAVARSEGVFVRVYVPFGKGWMPYAVSQLRRNPTIAMWVIKDAFAAAALRLRS